MLFSSPSFLYVFAPIFFLLYWLLPWRLTILLAGSLLFYAWGEPKFVLVCVASSLLDWILGRQIAKGGSWGRRCLQIGVVSNLALLVYTKYTMFLLGNLNLLLQGLGVAQFGVPQILLPLGVSFIVFEKITYLVDIHRRIAEPATTFQSYLTYVFLFPKLLAGPIVKYHDIAGQLQHPTHRYEDVRDGLLRFLQGLGKKVLLADTLSITADRVFALPEHSLQPGTAWLGLVCFTLQIYFDFSGYSDMAIGLARILGFRLLENFRAPYLATSFTEFWKRWHISLSSWIKEYLYIPLGGNRVAVWRSYLNLCICFLLSGLWHGASWNFVLWGTFHGVMLVMDRVCLLRWQRNLPTVINVGITFLLVMLSWVLFRCETVPGTMAVFAALFGKQGPVQNTIFLENDTVAALVIGFGIIIFPALRSLPLIRHVPKPAPLVSVTAAFVLLLLCAGRISVNSLQPFLYFRF